MSAAAITDASAPAVPVTFTGRNGVFRRLVTRGAILELLTFGFYRFWLTTEIDGDALEYTGRSKGLLFGFLIAGKYLF